MSYIKKVYYPEKCARCKKNKIDNICTNCFLLTTDAAEWSVFDADYYELIYNTPSELISEDPIEIMTIFQFLDS